MPSSMHTEYPVAHTKKDAPNERPRGARLLFHSGAATIMAHGFVSLQNLALNNQIEGQYGGFFQYLTIIGLLASGIAMILSSFNDMLPRVQPVARLKRAFVLFAMPVEIVVASIYWPLVLFAPTMMFPPQPDLASAPEPSSSSSDLLFRIPLWMDLSMHALPTAALLIDFFFLERRYTRPATTIGAPLLAVSFGTAYSLWVEHCATINGKFPYPFLTVMDLPARFTLYVVATLGSLLTFWGLNWAHK